MCVLNSARRKSYSFVIVHFFVAVKHQKNSKLTKRREKSQKRINNRKESLHRTYRFRSEFVLQNRKQKAQPGGGGSCKIEQWKSDTKVKLRVEWPIAKFFKVKAVNRLRKRTTGFVTVDFHFFLGFIFSPFPSSRVIECYDNVSQRLLNTRRAFGHFWKHEMLFIFYGFGINRKKHLCYWDVSH